MYRLRRELVLACANARPVPPVNRSIHDPAVADWRRQKGTSGPRIIMHDNVSTDPADPVVNRAGGGGEALDGGTPAVLGPIVTSRTIGARNPTRCSVIDHLACAPFEPPPPAPPWADCELLAPRPIPIAHQITGPARCRTIHSPTGHWTRSAEYFALRLRPLSLVHRLDTRGKLRLCGGARRVRRAEPLSDGDRAS